VSHVRAPGDAVFNTDLNLVSLESGFGYTVFDKDETNVTSGLFSSSPTNYPDVDSFSAVDQITVYFLKYGFKYQASGFILTRIETLLFMAHVNNTNTTLNEAGAAALTGISVDKAAKTVTVSDAHTITEVYDYLQYYQSLSANTDLLAGGEIFSTVVGNSYTLKSDWSMVFTVAPSSNWTIVAANITAGAVFDLSGFDLNGTLFFDADGTYTITNSDITSVDTVDGNETVVINPVGSTTITSNLDATNITVNTPAKTLTLTGLITGSDVVILDVGTSTVLDSVDQITGTTFAYQYTDQTSIDIGIIKPGYVTQYIYELTLGSTDANIPISQRVDRNYS